ncbi:hypothetical protein MAC_05748 [Metarhizium acridum CQMa 102]|uniref:Oxidase ustYa n=1 Tax=Metarhizium acridum (strain CQMa 102) TaxID=655827 RepID=E9E7A0_METAQ|nr:uncharacterized protein MAC_05748 [Metarhizium acridum CQMa 102]EFY88275.1 hypothetical protein MAC_05748 [Metarhizium acridum CQMa 102]
MAPLPKSTARRHTVLLLCLFSSLLVSFALFTYFMLLPLSQFTTHHHASNKSYVPADLGALTTSAKTVEFARHDAYQSLGREHDHLWRDDLLPPNGGYLTLAHAPNDTAKLGVAMFHQLRCLAAIRSEMQRLHEHGSGDPAHRDQDRDRALACFDYLRQSLLCHADATIEADSGTDLTDGMGERQCKDWNILYKASTRSDDEPVTPDDLR